MAAKSERDAQNDRAALPFEPKRKRGKGKENVSNSEVSRAFASAKDEADKVSKKDSSRNNRKQGSSAEGDKGEGSAVSSKAQARVDEIRAANRRRAESIAKSTTKSRRNSEPDSDGSIPKVVSRRMVRRMAILSISPVAVGVSIFFLSYYLLSNQIVTFAPVVVLLTTMGCFGLGVVGLTYGMLSASWDDEPGSLIGLDEFKLNFGRIMDARKASKT